MAAIRTPGALSRNARLSAVDRPASPARPMASAALARTRAEGVQEAIFEKWQRLTFTHFRQRCVGGNTNMPSENLGPGRMPVRSHAARLFHQGLVANESRVKFPRFFRLSQFELGLRSPY